MSMFLPKVRTSYHLELHSGSDLFAKKKRAILPISTVQEVRAEHRASGLNQSPRMRRGSQSHSAVVIAGDKTGNTVWGSMQDNLDNAKAIQRGHPKDA